MSTEAFEDFYFRVCAGVDYAQMDKAMQAAGRADGQDRPRAHHGPGHGSDVQHQRASAPSAAAASATSPTARCSPAPCKDSVNGMIQFNCETLYRGTIFNSIQLEFKNGKVIEAMPTATANTKKLNEILDADEGARYIGEWSLGFNPHIIKPMKDILFDEKIAGSFPPHPRPGLRGSRQRQPQPGALGHGLHPSKDYGGGEIYFDGKLIRKDGLFVMPKLKGLNPEKLGGFAMAIDQGASSKHKLVGRFVMSCEKTELHFTKPRLSTIMTRPRNNLRPENSTQTRSGLKFVTSGSSNCHPRQIISMPKAFGTTCPRDDLVHSTRRQIRHSNW